MSPEERDVGLLGDILTASRRALSYTDDLTEQDFLADSCTQDAVLRNLMVIGEAANRLTVATRATVDLPWKKIIGQRHVAVHDYDKLDFHRIWQTVRTDLPPLVDLIDRYLAERA